MAVETLKTKHDKAWQNLSGRIDAKTLRSMCRSPNSQHSIREINWKDFCLHLDICENTKFYSAEKAIQSWRTKGRKQTLTKVRMGQNQFRLDLIKRFGPVCAFMGKTPIQALEAAHLYAYSDYEKHYDVGGVLLRRDLHRLFDLGLITVDPLNLRINIDKILHPYEYYYALQNKKLAIQISKKERKWFSLHQATHP